MIRDLENQVLYFLGFSYRSSDCVWIARPQLHLIRLCSMGKKKKRASLL